MARQILEAELAVPQSHLPQLVQVVQPPLQGGGAQPQSLLIHSLSQLPAVGIHLRTESFMLL